MVTKRNDIGTKFETGDVPSQADFKEIFDSFVHKDEDKATAAMVDAGVDDEHYVTPALLRLGLQNIGAITGGGNLPYKQHQDNFSGTFIVLDKLPIESSVKVFKNGQLLLEGGDGDYTINYETAVVNFSVAVENRNIEIDYWYKSTEPTEGSGNTVGDLQSVLDNGGTAELENEAQSSGVSVSFANEDDNSNVYISGYNGPDESNLKYAHLSIDNGLISLEQSIWNDDIQMETKLVFEDPIALSTGATIKIPSKSEGIYTLATTADITLQKAIDGDNHAVSTDGYSDVTFFRATEGGTTIDFTIGEESDYNTQLLMQSRQASLNGISPDLYSAFNIYEGDYNIVRRDRSTGSTTTIKSLNPVANTTINFPAKTAGTYTLATTSDFKTINGESIIGEGDILTPTSIDVSSTVSGIVNNTALQELGGVDKLINGIRIGKGNNNISYNTAIGLEALNSNTTGSSNTATGKGALKLTTTGAYNSSFGSEVLTVNTIGSYNSGFGAYSLYNNTTGSYNVGIGGVALVSNTSGNRNTSLGYSSLYFNTTGNNNTAIGYSSLQQNNGSYNIGLGYGAGSNISTGSNNTIIGNVISTIAGITTGSNNLIVSANIDGTITGITTGSGNVVIGKVSGLASSTSNTVIISNGAGNIVLQRSSTGEITAPNLTTSLINSGGTKSLVTKEYVDAAVSGGGGSEPYLVYTALVSQSGTSAPTAIVLKNTLGGAITFNYVGVGQYTMTSSSLFTSNKTAANAACVERNTIGVSIVDASTINLWSSVSEILYDGKLARTFVEIRVYS